MRLRAPFVATLFFTLLLVGCGRTTPSASDHHDWVTAASLTAHDAYTLQFKLNQAGIPHDFDQSTERTLLRVPAAYFARATNLVFLHTNRATVSK